MAAAKLIRQIGEAAAVGEAFGGDPKANTEALKEAGINTCFYVSPLTAHEWQSWRRSLYQFAPLLFRIERTIESYKLEMRNFYV